MNLNFAEKFMMLYNRYMANRCLLKCQVYYMKLQELYYNQLNEYYTHDEIHNRLESINSSIKLASSHISKFQYIYKVSDMTKPSSEINKLDSYKKKRYYNKKYYGKKRRRDIEN